VNLRAVGAGVVPKLELPIGDIGDGDASGAVVEEREILFDGNRVQTKIYDRSKLPPGANVAGPAIVTEFDSTTVILPGYGGTVDVNYNIIIDESR
ncbi:MAG: hydantoinase/oxoprolinase family protein, partial [Gaiellales bacterium]